MRMPLFKLSSAAVAALELRAWARHQHLDAAGLEALQLRRFRALVRHAGTHSPYYRDIIRDAGIDITLCTPGDFPVLTKAQLMERFDDIVTDRRITLRAVNDFLQRSTDPAERFLGDYRVVHTSGSSGQVGCFVFSGADWGRGLSLGGRHRAPPRLFKRLRTAFFGATGGHFAGVSVAASGRQGLNRLFFDVRTFEINRPLSETVSELNRFQPDLLVGYTTALKMLAQTQRDGTLKIAPTSIEATGEVVTDHDRSELKATFGCDVVNVYGCTEHMVMATATGDAGLLLHEDALICEVHDDHTLVTNLFNETLPLIRYRMGDVLRPRPQKQGAYRTLETVVGRSELLPRFTNEDGTADYLSPHTINEIFVADVRRFQMQLVDSESFVFRICLAEGAGQQAQARAVAQVRRRLDAVLRQKRMGNVRFTVDVVGDLPVDPATRKFRLILPP